MSDMLKVILSLSRSGSLLIIAVFLCRPLIRDVMSRQWQYYLWLVVIARLLLPFAPQDSFVGMFFCACSGGWKKCHIWFWRRIGFYPVASMVLRGAVTVD